MTDRALRYAAKCVAVVSFGGALIGIALLVGAIVYRVLMGVG